MKKVVNVGSNKQCTAFEVHNFHARELFSIIAPEYDFISRAFSLGRDPAWKRKLIRSLPHKVAPVCVDLASGTGDITFALAERYPDGSITGIDITPQMMHIATCRNTHKNIAWHLGDMCHVPLKDSSVDIVTAGYALWNAPSREELFAELRRILKPGGVAIFLDICRPQNRIGQYIEYVLLKIWGIFWSLMLHGSLSVYTHVVDGLFSFPTLPEIADTLQKNGFVKVHTRRFALGMIALIMFEKHR